jgi:GcrA cell cycle regulator
MGGASHWTEIFVEELRQRWAAGASAGQIAKELGNGITRSAVIGKAHRLKLTPHKHAHTAEGPPKPRKPYKKRKPIEKAIVTTAPPLPPEPPPPPRMRRLKLIALEPHHCRFPVGDPQQPSFFFCAANTEDGAVYCPWHMKDAFVKPREGRA